MLHDGNGCVTAWWERMCDSLVGMNVRQHDGNECATAWWERMWDSMMGTDVRQHDGNRCETAWWERMCDSLMGTDVRQLDGNGCATAWWEWMCDSNDLTGCGQNESVWYLGSACPLKISVIQVSFSDCCPAGFQFCCCAYSYNMSHVLTEVKMFFKYYACLFSNEMKFVWFIWEISVLFMYIITSCDPSPCLCVCI